ncbi:MAG: ribonuclease E/G [Proteobacteria bacterium]|nr:ribonuclease E/G [Pseudomonadota bacterium]
MTLNTLIEVGETTIRCALVEDGEAVELHIIDVGDDRAGAIYLARVKKVEAKLNAAFLDLGGGEAFLPFRHARALKDQGQKNISRLVAEGQTLLVKLIAPEAQEDGKLPLATANPMIAGRYALSGHLPGKALLSQKIAGPEKRAALTALLDQVGDGNSLVIRTNAEAVPPARVADEVKTLQALWKALEAGDGKVGMVLSALDGVERALRDYAPHEVEEVLINHQVTYLKAAKLADEKWPDLKGKIRHYQEPAPLFEAFGVGMRIDAALSGVILLPSGGNLKIEETSAMTVIDVNSGAGRTGTSPEGVYLATNLEAAKAVARELRFQNISGLIVVDFIDMRSKADQEKVVAALDQGLARDPLPVERTGLNRFGLLSLRRKRRGSPLKAILRKKP